jgi:hypothetical protein
VPCRSSSVSGFPRNRAHTQMITGYGGPSHGCLRAFGKTGQEKLTSRRRVYATSTDNANAGNGPVIPLC